MANLPPWMQGCLENVRLLTGCGTTEECEKLLCDPGWCADSAPSGIHAVCNCLPPYPNGCAPTPYPGCCTFGPESPIWTPGPGETPCYCCCSEIGGAWNADAEDSWKPAAELAEGQTLLVARDAGLQHWSERPLAFRGAAWAPAGAQVRIRFRRGAGGEETVTAHRRQPFLLAGGRLRRAGELVPGTDALVARDGGAAPVVAVEDAPEGTVYMLATSREPATSVDGHLILANGVVAGDFALQLADLDAIGA